MSKLGLVGAFASMALFLSGDTYNPPPKREVLAQNLLDAQNSYQATYGVRPGETDPSMPNAMRLQLQYGTNNLWSAPIVNTAQTGVTVRQVQAMLNILNLQIQLGMVDVSKTGYQGAMINMSSRLNQIPPSGVIQGGNVLRSTFTTRSTIDFSDYKKYRIDLENLRGHNLRQF